jgi:hypothetical protein
MLHMDFSNCDADHLGGTFAGTPTKGSRSTLEQKATVTHISNVQTYNSISSNVH